MRGLGKGEVRYGRCTAGGGAELASFLGECRGGCKAARGAVGVKKDSRGGLHWTGGHCCQWFWMQMIHQPPSCDAMQLHCQWDTVCALEIMHFSSRNCITHPIYDGQPTVHCSFGPTVQPHSCCKSFSFYFHTLCICTCICICTLYLYFDLYLVQPPS